MWSKLRSALVIGVSCALLLFFFGFAIDTPASMPNYALVFLDDTNAVYLAPQCLGHWQRHAPKDAPNLRRGTAGEARRLGYAPEGECAKTSAFTPPGPSVSRLALEKVGLIGGKRQWWDVPYRTEEGMVYPPNTHV